MGLRGDRYRRLNWDKVLLNKPNKVTIISLAGDQEQNDVYDMRIGDYPKEMGRTEYWSYPEMYWEMTKDYIQNYRKLRNGEIEHMAEYGWKEINGQTITVDFTTIFKKTPVVFASFQGSPETTSVTLQVTHVGPASFSVKTMGDIAGPLRINWFAVLPGNWITSNGMKVSAGQSSEKGNKVRIDPGDHCGFSPAILSLPNGDDNKTVGWIALEAGRSEMWSGRFCAAQQVKNPGCDIIDFSLPRYFYDKVLTFVDSHMGRENSNGNPSVVGTSNLGGTLRCTARPDFQPAMLDIVSFDGGGGCLYATKTGFEQ